MRIIVGISGASGSVYGWRLLEKLRRLAFAEKVPEPKRPEQIELELDEGDAAVD